MQSAASKIRQRKAGEESLLGPRPARVPAGASASGRTRNLSPGPTHRDSGKHSLRSNSLARGGLAAIATLVAFWLALVAFGLVRLAALPEPRGLANQADLHFSEESARATIGVLARDIGLRTTGTGREDQTYEFLLRRIAAIQRMAATNPVAPIVDVQTQHAKGSHRFDFMGEPLIKVYSNITNVIVKVSCGSECDENVLMLNAHFDTMPMSPGASDDAAGCAVMLEVLRVIVQTPKKLKNSIVFLFNGAEETLQDGSHAFVTQHGLAKNIKAFLNLEAMGLNGKEILFQAGSDQLVDAYRRVPHPHGASVSNDLFATGLIMSDTDYRQFVQYGGLLGLDFAFYQGSYVYHTMLDVEENIEPGALQHYGDNILVLTNHIAYDMDLSNLSKTQSLVYFDFLGYFFVYYARETAVIAHYGLVVFTMMIVSAKRQALGLSTATVIWEALKSLINIAMCIVFALVASLILTLGLNTPMTWFSHESYPFALFGPFALCGLLFFPVLQRMQSKGLEYDAVAERRTLLGLTTLWVSLLALSTQAGLGASFVCAFHVGSLLLGLIIDSIICIESDPSKRPVPIAAYMATMAVNVSQATSMAYPILKLFVPLTGRIGTEPPVDAIVSVVTCVAMLMMQTYLVIPLTHRVAKSHVQTLYRAGLIAGLFILGLFSLKNPFDAMHPKVRDSSTVRVFVGYLENVTSGDRGIYIAMMDPARRQDIVKYAGNELGLVGVKQSQLQTDRDWSTLFPFSHFVDNYYFNVTEQAKQIPGSATPPRVVSESVYDEAKNERTITLTVYYPGYIWNVVSFEAHVVSWSIAGGTAPRTGSVAHHTIRHVGGHRCDHWNMSMTVVGREPIWMEVSGMERDGYHEMTSEMHNSPRQSHLGMQWKWTDRWASASILSRMQGAMPEWTSGFFLGAVVQVFWI
eukprot:jgi/Hompol1/584/HPOL_005359-RA